MSILGVLTSMMLSPTPGPHKAVVYENPELIVTFKEGAISKPLPTAKVLGTLTPVTHWKFCRQPIQPPHVQQVYSGDGWLCHFYVLPPQKPTQALKEQIRKHAHSVMYEKKRDQIGLENLAGQPMWVWRDQQGKTRLDTFLVFGQNHSYLWVSSPYGDGAHIRELLKRVKWKKRSEEP